MMQSDGNLGGGTAGGESGGLGSTGSGTGASSGTGSTGAGGAGSDLQSGGSDIAYVDIGSGTGSTGGGPSGTPRVVDHVAYPSAGPGSAGGVDASGTGAGGLSGVSATGSTGAGVTEGGGFTTGDDFGTHEETYRRHYTVGVETETPAPSYEAARPGYELGHQAASNPAYAGRTYEEVEVELEREQPGRLAAVRGYARHAFNWKTAVGALALAGGAWWASRKLSETVSELSEEEERECRTLYESHPARASVPYDHARTVYVVGYVAARNPDYSGRAYDDVEPHLRSGFTGPRTVTFDSLRDFGRRGYERGSSRRTS